MKLKAASPERLVKLTQAADLAPAESRYQQQLAMEYYNQGDFKSCIARIDRAMQAQPDNSMLLTIKGSAFIELGNYEQAARSHEAALQKDPKNVWAAYNLALALGLAHSERTAGAWRDFIALAEKDPEQRDLVERARKSLADLEGNR